MGHSIPPSFEAIRWQARDLRSGVGGKRGSRNSALKKNWRNIVVLNGKQVFLALFKLKIILYSIFLAGLTNFSGSIERSRQRLYNAFRPAGGWSFLAGQESGDPPKQGPISIHVPIYGRIFGLFGAYCRHFYTFDLDCSLVISSLIDF